MTLPVSKLRLYLDTTIPSYVYAIDSPRRMLMTQKLMRLAHASEFEMLISDVVLREISRAAEPKQGMLFEVVKGLTVLSSSSESYELAEAYIEAGALPRSSIGDARHVAIATLHKVDALVSWNFDHLVNIRRSKIIATVNAERGLAHIEILSPEEVVPS